MSYWSEVSLERNSEAEQQKSYVINSLFTCHYSHVSTEMFLEDSGSTRLRLVDVYSETDTCTLA